MTDEEFRTGRREDGTAIGQQFDYMAECDKTCSTVFRPDQVEVLDFRHVLIAIVGFCNDLNVIKKLLFRGKTREEMNFGEVEKPTLDDIISNTAWSPADIDVLHGAIGTITEAGEVAEYLLRWAEGKGFDRVNVMEEAGDQLWYIVRSLRGIGLTLEQCGVANIDKLRGRHGAAFDVFRDANRDLNAEHGKLEDAFNKPRGTPLFAEPIPVIKNPELDKLADQLSDEPSKAEQSKDLNAEIHAQGVAHVKAAHGDMADMVDKIKATNGADAVSPVPKGGVRG